MRDGEGTIDSLRCPVCYVREIDVLLLHDSVEYYCVKCSFRGSAETVRAAHAHAKAKYRNISKRLTIQDISRL